MQHSQVHPIFAEILNSIFPGNEETLPTTEGDKTIPQILNKLGYACYEYNRDEEGMSHEQLVKIGLGTEEFKQYYEAYKKETL